jgi:glucose/arabinose dehydrogenase
MRASRRSFIILSCLFLLPVLTGCGEDSDFSFQAVPEDEQASSALAQPDPRSVDAFEVFPHLRFKSPLFLTAVPGTGSLLAVVEQAGVIKVFDGQEGADAVTLLDISEKVESGGEEGLLGLAFDPDFSDNGYFYVNYTVSEPDLTVVSRFTAVNEAGKLEADQDSEAIILEQSQPLSNHNGGMLAFGPDGYLYVALGDGGGQGDPDERAQDLTTILGKILRIDVASDAVYDIPGDNPFINQPGARGEIWAYGFRNPYRFSFDRETGALWAGDVGQGNREEIDLVVRGGNYGWNLYEGSETYRNPEGRAATEFVMPVIDYGRTEGISVIGGYVYRGSLAPSLRGAYIFGDYGSGKVWALVYDEASGVVASNVEIAEVSTVSSLGEDADGELYIISLEGGIYRLEE